MIYNIRMMIKIKQNSPLESVIGAEYACCCVGTEEDLDFLPDFVFLSVEELAV